MTEMTASPFRPISMLFVMAADSELLAFLEEIHELVVGCPDLLKWVDCDLDRHGLRKKALRQADAAWIAGRSGLLLPEGAAVSSTSDDKAAGLDRGRPRTPAYVVLVALLLRGFFGQGFKASDVDMMMQESMTLRVFFANLGLNMPKRSTLTELVNAVSNATRLRILDAQIAQILRLGWDDFSTILQDSTHVAGNTAWPTDSGLVVSLVSRMLRIGATLSRVGLPVFKLPQAEQHLGVLTTLNREISMLKGTKEQALQRRKKYSKVLWRARRVLRMLRDAITQVDNALISLDALPSRRVMAERVVQRLHSDVDALTQVIANCDARVMHEQKIAIANKKLSISDEDAGFIAKGQRDPVIGYKPQLARSGAGFVVGLQLPKGNAADSQQLIPMVQEVINRTTVVPKIVSVDDGYASQENKDTLRAKGIEVVSISGSKGRALTADDDWNSDQYILARDKRSAVESLMFTLKQGFDFGEVARRGLDNVYGELLEKVLAYNICRTARIRATENLDKEMTSVQAA